MNENTSLSPSEKLRILNDKFAALLKPAVVTLEKTIHETSRTPETQHERWFQAAYIDLLKKTIFALKVPYDSTIDPEAGLNYLKEVRVSCAHLTGVGDKRVSEIYETE